MQSMWRDAESHGFITMNTVNLLKQFQTPEAKLLPITKFKNNDICALTGQEITEGVKVEYILSDAISKPYEVFQYESNFVSVDAGRLYQWFRGGLVGNIFTKQGLAIKPMVSRDSSQKLNRVCWIDLIKNLKQNTKTVAIFSQESKSRLWINSRVGVVGDFWDIYLNDGNFNGILTINHSKLLECIAICENIYRFGCNKTQIKTNVLDVKTARKLSKINKLPITQIINNMQVIEKTISSWRNTNEFKLCLFIIQPPITS